MICGNCGRETVRVRIAFVPDRRECCSQCAEPVTHSHAIKVYETGNVSVSHARDIRSRKVNMEGGTAVVRRGSPPSYFIPR